IRPLPLFGLLRDQGIGAYLTSNILEALLAQIDKFDRDFADNLFVSRRRNADAPRFSYPLEAGCDVDTVPKNIMRLNNNVADIDADAKSNAPVFHPGDCKFLDARLELHSGPNRFDRARKFRQESVAGVLHDATAVLRDRGLDSVRQECRQTCVRRL